MLYAEIYPKVRRHNARPSPSGRALCLLTLGHISAYNMGHITWTTQYYCINSKDMECTSETRFAICQLTNITHLTMFIYIYTYASIGRWYTNICSHDDKNVHYSKNKTSAYTIRKK